MTCPSVQVLSVLSTREDILRSSVLDVLAKALRSCSPTAPCGPYVPDVQPQHLPRHVEDTKPDFTVLVSEYDDFLDVESIPAKKKQFRDLFHAVKPVESTKMLFVVTSDATYKDGDLCSRPVERTVNKINCGILKQERITILSWKDLPSGVHHDVIQKQIGSCKPRPRQPTVASIIPQCRDKEKGLLRYKAVVKDGYILAVLHSDPFYWKPDDGSMKDVLKQYQVRATIKMWESKAGTIETTVKKEDKCVHKLLHAEAIPSQPDPSQDLKTQKLSLEKGLHENASKFNIDPKKLDTFVPPEQKPKPESPPGSQKQTPLQDNSRGSDSRGTSQPFYQDSDKPSVKLQETQVNQPRHLPPAPGPIISTTESTTLSLEPAQDVKKPKTLDKEPPTHHEMTCPSVHVLSVHSTRDDILRSSVLDGLAKVLRSCSPTAPCGPYVPDVQPQHLPRHVDNTRPDFIVLVSEYDDFLDVEHISVKKKQFRDLLLAAKPLEKTTMLFVVTSDARYKEGDLCSRPVEHMVNEINCGILKQERITILSWKDLPSQIHHDVLYNRIGSSKPRQHTEVPVMPQYRDAEKGLLRYKAVVKDGYILAVLHSDPFYWKPNDGSMKDALKQHQVRATIEMWENKAGTIDTAVKKEDKFVRKLLDVGSSERHHSLQVYAYHGDERTFEEMYTFFQGIGFQYRPLKTPMNEKTLIENITQRSPDRVAVSIDFECFQDKSDLEGMIHDYWPLIKPISDKLKGIVIIVTGDRSNGFGELLVSRQVQVEADRLLAGLGISHKVTMMSWDKRPFIVHHDTMKNLLKRPQQLSQPTTSWQHPYDQPHTSQTTSYPVQHQSHRPGTGPDISLAVSLNTQDLRTKRQADPSVQNEGEYDPSKGYLRFRAELVYGRVQKVIVCLPPGWCPDQRDLDFMADKHKDTPKAILEFWGYSYYRPPGPPVVVIEQKSSRFSIPVFAFNK